MKKYILLLFLVLIISCKQEKSYLYQVKASKIEVSKETPSSKKIDSFIQPYKESIEKEMNLPLSYTKKDLTKNDGVYESSLGNLMADLCYEKANPIFKQRTGKNIDFVLLNHGGIRAPIYKGIVTKKDAFNIMPFENALVVVEISYEKLTEMVAYLKRVKRAHPLSKHIKLVINPNDFSLKINNKPAEKKRNYFVLTSDYLQHGGDRMYFFKDPINLYNIDYKIRQTIIDYFTETDTLKTQLDKRLQINN